MATRNMQHGGNPYNEEFAIPSTPKGKSDANRIDLLESKVALLTKLLFEKSPNGPNGPVGLYFKKTLQYASGLLQIELVSDSFFNPGAIVDIRFTISSISSPESNIFYKRFRVTCNSKGSFPRVQIMTTLDLQKKAKYADMLLNAVTVDITTNSVGSIAYVQDVVL